MLKIYKSLESGPLTELSLKTLEKGAWINIIDPTPYELKVIAERTGVEMDFLRSALDDEERSHTDVEDNAIVKLGRRILTVHISDYDFIDERHWLPGEGKNDWNAILAALQAVGYAGPFMYEVRAYYSSAAVAENKKLLFERFNALQG